ncbi:MAG TPA: non-ribosomal peptide synthetase [Pseudonocardiaceae bacterium]|nr:non-ribosomal peptide synthetase [Pseudonocardiaceae bacterium]
MAITRELRGRLLGAFNGRRVPYSQDRTILQLFEDRARERPDAPALTVSDRTLSYRQLNGHANALAEQLHQAGVGRGDFVPLVLRNGLELPLSMLALMKLAAPFVPLDDLHPAERLDGMIATVEPKVVLYSPASGTHTRWTPSLLVNVADLGECDSDDFGPPAGMNDIIYGFYTSGSTGLPKCTVNIHRGLLNRFGYMTRRFSGRTDEVVLQNSRQAFDSSLWQLLWPLTIGSRVVIPDCTDILDLAATVELIRGHGVTMTDFVPSIFNTLVEMLDAQPAMAADLVSLRRLLIGGEEINADAVQRFRRLLPDVQITNTYGPTEASIGSVFHDVTDADAESIPIGRPIDNTYAVVLDERAELVPPGTSGEIHIGGDCLGLGYLHDPEKTHAAFIPNPFPEIPGPRLYRTGDMGYVRSDGLLAFVGRRDHQVKIGGVRVELSEIEHAMLAHPQVRDAKVILSEQDGVRRLVAFLTHDNYPSTAELRRHARELLLPSLVPKQFVLLDSMPLTPNGKTDRLRLAALAAVHEAPAEPDVKQPDDAWQVIRDIWRRLLAEPAPSTSADFFQLGGDSMSMQRLALALSHRFGLRVTARDIVTAPTIEQQAELVTGQSTTPERGRPVLPQWEADVRLPDDITGNRPPASNQCCDVLLTGATGFVGAQLLHELLTRTDATVHCLVRADDQVTARCRLTDNLRTYQLWDDAVADRIVAVPGDLSAPGLGLSERDHGALAERVDTVVHNGALVNLILGYGAHRPANVTGTLSVLRLASTTTTKRVHFISTFGVVAVTELDRRPGLFPEASPPVDQAPPDGYSQSKWVAEQLLGLAEQHGIPMAVYRLGEVMPHSRTGVPNPRGLAELLVHACLRLGMTFTSPIVTDYTPVDQVAELVVAGLRAEATGYFHLVAPRPVRFNNLLSAFARPFGLRPVDYAEFWHAVRTLAAARSGEVTLANLLAVIPPADTRADLTDQLASAFRDNTALFDTTRAAELAERAGVWPWGLDSGALERYVDYHRTVGRAGREHQGSSVYGTRGERTDRGRSGLE